MNFQDVFVTSLMITLSGETKERRQSKSRPVGLKKTCWQKHRTSTNEMRATQRKKQSNELLSQRIKTYTSKVAFLTLYVLSPFWATQWIQTNYMLDFSFVIHFASRVSNMAIDDMEMNDYFLRDCGEMKKRMIISEKVIPASLSVDDQLCRLCGNR